MCGCVVYVEARQGHNSSGRGVGVTNENKSEFREEGVYAAAFSEIEAGATHPGLWAKAFAESDGDELKTKARYITLRVQYEEDRIKQDRESALANAAALAKQKVDAFSLTISQLDLQGYHVTHRGAGWMVREPHGARLKFKSDVSLLEYASDKIKLPPELQYLGRTERQEIPQDRKESITTSAPMKFNVRREDTGGRMQFHDKLAQRALSEGRTSLEFHAAAQKHANATWLYLAAGGLVWWLVSWVWALLPFAVAAYVAFQSTSATSIATRLEKFES
jgi:hypothetical protein